MESDIMVMLKTLYYVDVLISKPKHIEDTEKWFEELEKRIYNLYKNKFNEHLRLIGK